MTHKLDKTTIIVSSVLLCILVVAAIIVPDAVVNGFVSAKKFIINYLGAFFMVFVAGILAYNLYLAFSKYGNIRYGIAKPKYSTFGWVAMVFCTAFSMSILFWGAVEWAYYVTWLRPFDMSMEESAKFALTYNLFHWGIPVWSIYVVGVAPVAYRYYVRKKPGLSLQNGCEGVIGEKRAKGSMGTLINIIFIFGNLGGLTISYGAGIPMMTSLINRLFGTPANFTMTLVLTLIITVVFTWSSIMGIDKGILNFSRICLILCVVMLAYIFCVGHPLFSIENTVQSLGSGIQNFIPMMFYTDPTRSSGGFPQEWTIFYWAWWISMAPVIWIFITKISEGRTMRSVIITVLGAGLAGSVLFFGVISNYGIGEVLLKNFNWDTLGSNGTMLDTFAKTGDENGLVGDFLLSLPFGNIVMIIWLLASFFLIVTMMDSSSYIMGAACTKNLTLNEEPRISLRVFWAVMSSVCPLTLLWAGADLSGVKSVLIITAIPVSFCIIMCMISCYKWIHEDFGHMGREEIKLFFMTDEEKRLAKERRAEAEKRLAMLKDIER